MVKCPKCSGATRVYKTAPPRRRRECLDCGFRFTTREEEVVTTRQKEKADDE
jgi:transcriptional regulator NrdR family protein